MGKTGNHGVAIQTRNINFDVPADLPKHWHSGNPWITHYFNALSTMFPDGEKFFVDAVRHYRDQVDDPKLLEEIRGFCGQEGIHAREHRELNEVVEAQGVPMKALEKQVTRFIALDRKLPHLLQLAITASLEHFTAIMADVLLREARALEGAHPAMQRLWKWHAMEEAEHKAVAFDVLKTVAPGWRGYFVRVLAMVWTTVLFNLNIIGFHLWLVWKDGSLGDAKARSECHRFFFKDPGLAGLAFRNYWSWYRPSFHPWDHDNSKLVENLRESYA